MRQRRLIRLIRVSGSGSGLGGRSAGSRLGGCLWGVFIASSSKTLARASAIANASTAGPSGPHSCSAASWLQAFWHAYKR